MLRRLAGTLTRQFSDEPRAHIMAGDHSDSLDFLQNDFIKEEDIPELSLDADVDYLEAIVDKADENEFLYRASEANQKLEIFTSDDFEKLIKHQYAILGFNFSEFMKIADYGLLEKAQRMIDSRDISLAVKVRLVSHIKQLQTNKNILAIFKSALDQAFEDEFKEIEILVLASANQSQPLSEALRHMVVQASNLDKLKKPSFFLLSMMAIFIPESTKEFVEAALTGSKKRIGQAIQIVDQFSESDSLNTIMTDKSLAAVLNNAGFCRLSLLLQIIEIYMKRQNASPEDCIDLLMTLNPALKVDLLLDYPTELLMKISRDQKMILYWLFSKNLMNLKLKEDPHRTKLIDLVDNLLLFDDSSTNYLCRLMMRSLR
jgi:hypothetical protein